VSFFFSHFFFFYFFILLPSLPHFLCVLSSSKFFVFVTYVLIVRVMKPTWCTIGGPPTVDLRRKTRTDYHIHTLLPPDDVLLTSPKRVEVKWLNKVKVNTASGWFHYTHISRCTVKKTKLPPVIFLFRLILRLINLLFWLHTTTAYDRQEKHFHTFNLGKRWKVRYKLSLFNSKRI
jgi:hypothetical protein